MKVAQGFMTLLTGGGLVDRNNDNRNDDDSDDHFDDYTEIK